ncbi:GtrA family protein [Pilimelia columellifera]|uniref:GtrA family protein n=1 Tax=Pilimelia columellifera subsp. columellifera TaxID=706583 RepID=A0ABP6AD04_9ACTN
MRPAQLTRLLPARVRGIAPEALRFLTVGLVNTGVNFAVFNALILTVFADGQLKANVAATAVATVTSYVMNRRWTYSDRPRAQVRREFLLFAFFNVSGLAIELLVLGLAKYGLGLTGVLAINAAKALGVGLGTVFRFWSYRTFVFTTASKLNAAAAEQTVVAPRPRRGHRRPVATETVDREFDELTHPLDVALPEPARPARR